VKKIFAYLKPYVFRMVIGLIIKLTGTIVELLLPWILSYIIDDVIPLKSIKLITLWGGAMFLCSVCALAFNIIANRMASMVSRNATERIRNDLFSSMIYLSNKQMDEVTMPSLIQRATSDTYNIHQMLGMMQRLGVRAPIMLIGGIAITLSLDPVLTLAMVSVMPFIVIVLVHSYKKGIPKYSILQKKSDSFVRIVREDIAGIRVIKALSKTDYEKSKFARYNLDVVDQEKSAGKTMSILNPAMNLFLNLGIVLVIITGAWRVNQGTTEPGKIIAFLTYVTLIINALIFISRMFIIYSKASASAKRINEILDMEPEMKVIPMEEKNPEYSIEFDNVCFSYNKKGYDLQDISFVLKKGETLGIIGATGSGKSTMVQLLMRFYDVDSGAIRINGRDVRSIERKELMQKFGVVFQNDFISADTIWENIRFGREMEDDDIMEAASYAKALSFIQDKPDGFQSVLAIKGANLSGGQKQRVLIARALAGSPEILILDDSSSALDYKTDAALRKELRSNFTETSTIMIAQRVSSIMYADHIMVLDEGKIVGYGSHKELKESCSIYREISQSQMGDEDHE
jgi:ATP-binding cassette subfamily B protein